MQSLYRNFNFGWLLTLVAGVLFFGGFHGPGQVLAQDETTELMEHIKARGKIVVGVKTDYPPWGGMNEDAVKVGLEPDLARNLARRLGVGLELVGVSSANRLSKVEDGSIDLVIATMGDNLKRREIAGMLEPNYYASGVNILVHKGIKLRDWGELRGRKVCLTEGAFFNRDITQRYLIDPVIFKGTRDTQLALEAGRCIGWAYDDTALAQLVGDERWQDFGMPLSSIMIGPWAMAVSKANQDGSFARFVEDTIAEWHRTGYLLKREAAWKIPESRFLVEQNLLFNKKDENDEYICERNDDGEYPIICRNQKIARETGTHSLLPPGSIRGVLVELGLDFLPLKDPYVGKQLLNGILLTIVLSLVCVAGSLMYMLIMSIIHAVSAKPIRHLVIAINSIFRMTPPILNLYIVFFGIGTLVAAKWGYTFNAVIVAAIVFSQYAGASNSTIVIKAIANLRKNQPEAGLGIILPQAINAAFTGLVANSVNIVKAIGIASVIAVPELVSTSNRILSENGNTMEMMNFLMVFYFFLVAIFLYLLNRLNAKVTKWVAAKS